MGASQETEEALKQYLKENPELKEIAAGSSEAKKKRRVHGFLQGRGPTKTLPSEEESRSRHILRAFPDPDV